MASNNEVAELVLVPTPGMGHLLAAVELAKLILRRNHRISVLIFIIRPPMNSTMLDDFVDSQSHDNPYPTRLTYQTLPPLSNPPKLSSFAFFHTLVELHKPFVKQAIEDRIRAGSPRLSGFILDMFCSTMIDVGNDFNVPSYIFFASGASMLNLMFHFRSLVDEKGVDISAEYSDPDVKFDVPGFTNQLVGKVVPFVCLDKEGGSTMILDMARRFRKCQGIIVNTYTELETCGLQALFDQVDRAVHKKPKPRNRPEKPRNRTKREVTVPVKFDRNGSVTEPVKLAVKRFGYGYEFWLNGLPKKPITF